MKYFVTGAAGFIGSTLVDRLLADGHDVVGYDNLSTGQQDFLTNALACERYRFVQADVLDTRRLARELAGAETVFHLAANADVRFGTDHPRKDLEQNTLATFSVLEAMREAGARRIAFASTGSVYGEAKVFPTPEDAAFPVQTSLYGASKLAGEGLIAAYCEGFGFQGWIFRFVSILGERYTHGHVFDFYRALRNDPTRLRVLGDGHQRKSYLDVQDCVAAMRLAMDRATDSFNVFNLGASEYVEVRDSIGWIVSHLGLTPTLDFTGGDRGWIGDNPFIFLDTARIRALGWMPRVTIREGVIKTLEYLVANPHLLDIVGRPQKDGATIGRP